MQISGQPAYYVVYIGRYPSSKFYYDGGQVSTISARFSFLTGFAFFKNVKVINFISTFVSLSSATVIVENCYFRYAIILLWLISNQRRARVRARLSILYR